MMFYVVRSLEVDELRVLQPKDERRYGVCHARAEASDYAVYHQSRYLELTSLIGSSSPFDNLFSSSPFTYTTPF